MPLVVYLWIAFTLNYVDRQMVYSIFPALRADLGFDSARLGLLASVFMWVYTLGMPVAGWMADRWRAGRLVWLSLVLWSAATIGCALAGSAWVFLGWRGMIGLTEALYFPAALQLLAARYPVETRSRALGFHQSAMYVGVMAGGWFGGWAADGIGWRSGFALAGLLGLAYSAVLWRPVYRAEVVGQHKAAGDWRALARSGKYLALAGAFCAFNAVQWVVLAWYPTFLQDRFHLSMTDSGWNATVFVQVSLVVGIFAGGALADFWRRRRPMARLYVAALGVMGSGPLGWMVFQAASLEEARWASAGFGFFAGLLAANAFSGAYDVTPEDTRGLAGALLNMSGGLSASVMIYLAGLWRETVGFAPLVGITGTAAVAAAVLLWIVASRRPLST
ncbi:MAG: MFS transporter [Bryobacter sp.]|jgi:MFS family permease|nr:MFS transporter [Bryobacter sp. CoA8 C33]